MDESDFEGTLVLEQLAAIGKVDDFFDAIDADDTQRATDADETGQRRRIDDSDGHQENGGERRGALTPVDAAVRSASELVHPREADPPLPADILDPTRAQAVRSPAAFTAGSTRFFEPASRTLLATDSSNQVTHAHHRSARRQGEPKAVIATPFSRELSIRSSSCCLHHVAGDSRTGRCQ